MDTYRGRVFSKFFSIGSFTLVIPSALILGLVPKDSAIFRSGPLLGTLWFIAFAATCFFSCALLYVVSFRRFGVGTEKLNCFDIIWIDPFDPSRCLPAGQWRALTVFLSMSVVVNLLIFFFIDRRAIGFDGIKSLPFFLFWGNVLYGAGLIFEIFRILKEELRRPRSRPSNIISQPFLGEDLCLAYRTYWLAVTTLIVFLGAHALSRVLDENLIHRPAYLSFLSTFLLIPLALIGLFGLGIYGAKRLGLKSPRIKI